MSLEIFIIREVAEFQRLSTNTAYRLAAAGELPGFWVGGLWRCRRDAVEKFTKETVVTTPTISAGRGGKK